MYQDILGLRFEELIDAHTWHRDVRMYAVYDRSTNAFMGQFYLGIPTLQTRACAVRTPCVVRCDLFLTRPTDLWPREGKYPHAAVFPLVPSHHFPSASSSNIPASFLAHLHPTTGNACSPFVWIIIVPSRQKADNACRGNAGGWVGGRR